MTSDLHTGPLGAEVDYPQSYTPDLLFPMPRMEGRSAVDVMVSSWLGRDIWTGYEFSWLNVKGKPEVAGLQIIVDASSSHIVESKSMKLYLNGYAQTRFADANQVHRQLQADLSAAFGGQVQVHLVSLDHLAADMTAPRGLCLDSLDVTIVDYQRKPELLTLQASADSIPEGESTPVEEQLISHLFRSLCPVTAQPDWASIFVHYRGPQIAHESLLAYLISYREHQAFHETTIERIYADIWHRCKPEMLAVTGRFLRRGGLDINPSRVSPPEVLELLTAGDGRLARQ